MKINKKIVSPGPRFIELIYETSKKSSRKYFFTDVIIDFFNEKFDREQERK
jgi:hypothetical protein